MILGAFLIPGVFLIGISLLATGISGETELYKQMINLGLFLVSFGGSILAFIQAWKESRSLKNG